ncbi:polysaccharide deacetylase family protein [Rhizobium sp. WYJ-E13]|uniref:polysaccharide deacetylase family protein n=1 Tax=Rhizobium sp. WYJ-E13 TaxID=2849093 RepID=UPI001C1EB0CB|nr:polysaccharide deacetylase family protein [Rhizobium sp. WYJ-E13]QWW70627.1 polysaccharide deacetylase family protein [Rhizobium sp. WYJ-E13]
MIDSTIHEPLYRELERWRAAGRVARLWLRDDDATEPTAALERLLSETKSHGIPVTLAVIPAFTGAPLAQRLAGEAHVSVAVHGWSHHNHAGPHDKKQELGGARLEETILGELYEGLLKLKGLYPTRFLAMLVPPWNRIDKGLIPKLPALGFESLSTYGRVKGESPLAIVNSHVDLMDWHGTRGGRPMADLIGELVAELQDRFAGSSEPIGVLAHHLVHDAAAWDFLAELFEATSGHPAVEWVSAAALVQDQMSMT